MPKLAVCTVDTIDTGHACDGTALIQGNLQSKVYVGGDPVAVVGDSIQVHTILAPAGCVPHTAFINAGSSKVSIGGIPVARLGDSADAGSINSGSGKVSAGG